MPFYFPSILASPRPLFIYLFFLSHPCLVVYLGQGALKDARSKRDDFAAERARVLASLSECEAKAEAKVAEAKAAEVLLKSSPVADDTATVSRTSDVDGKGEAMASGVVGVCKGYASVEEFALALDRRRREEKRAAIAVEDAKGLVFAVNGAPQIF